MIIWRRGKKDMKTFLRKLENSARSSNAGLLTKFAERNGELTEDRVENIARFIFSKKYHEFVSSYAKAACLDLGCVAQMAVCAANLCLRGARGLALSDNETMFGNLFVQIAGPLESGKPLLAKPFLKEIVSRQVKEWKKHEKEMEPLKPSPSMFYYTGADIDTAFDYARSTPEGIIWHMVDGEQRPFGASPSNLCILSSVTTDFVDTIQGC